MAPSISPSASISPSTSISPSSSASPSPEVDVVMDTALTGVYTLGQYSTTYPIILDLTYPISERNRDDLVIHDVEIGSILVSGDDIFITWYNHTAGTYGVDKVDYDNKLNGAFLESLLIPIYRRAYANYTSYIIAYDSLPEDTSLEMYYSTDYGVNYTQLDMIDDTDRRIVSADLTVETTQLMIKVVVRTSGNNAPSFESIGVQAS